MKFWSLYCKNIIPKLHGSWYPILSTPLKGSEGTSLYEELKGQRRGKRKQDSPVLEWELIYEFKYIYLKLNPYKWGSFLIFAR